MDNSSPETDSDFHMALLLSQKEEERKRKQEEEERIKEEQLLQEILQLSLTEK